MNNVIGNRRNGKQVFYMLNGRVDASTGKSLKINVGSFDVQIAFQGTAEPSIPTSDAQPQN